MSNKHHFYPVYFQSPDMESFKLIVDSVEGLRELTKQFEEPEPIIIKRGKKEQVGILKN